MIQMLRLHQNEKKAPKGPLKHMDSLDAWPSGTNSLQKVFVLAEQLTFAKYLLAIEPKNPAYVSFKEKCIKAVHMLDMELMNIEPSLFTLYNKNKQTLKNIAYAFDKDSAWIEMDSILDDVRFTGEFRQLPKEFYSPFLYSVCGTVPDNTEFHDTSIGKTKVTFSPVILYPTVYREGSKLYLTYTTETFSTFSYSQDSKLFSDPSNPILTHLCRYNWSGKKFGDIVKTISNLKLELNSFNDSSNITSAVYRGLLSTGSEPIKNCKGTISAFMTFVNTMSNVYGMPLTDITRTGTFLSRFDGFDPEAVKYLMVRNPSLQMKKSFDSTPELKFLNSRVEERIKRTLYGKEAANKEDGTSLDATDDDTYNVEQDDSFSDGTDQTSTEDSFDMGDEFSDDDMVSPDGSFEDTGDTFSSDEGSTEAIGADEEDTQPEDPTTIAYNVLAADPSAEAIMYRHRVARALRGAVKNPPQELTTSTVAALKTWLTQWLYLVSPSTTKRFLTLLLNNQSITPKA